MRFLACALLPFIFGGLIYGSSPVALSSAEQEVVNACLARRDAALKRDMTSWNRLVSDDCIFSTDDGALATKSEVAEHYRKLPIYYDHTADPRDFVVHLYGDTAVLNYRATAHEQFTDADIVSEFRTTETFIKRNGMWLLVAVQWGNLPVNFRKPLAVAVQSHDVHSHDARSGEDYVGQYEWRPNDDIETVSLKDGRLWTKQGSDEDEYLPLGKDTFFVRSDLGTFVFSRDTQGRVNGYTYHRADGQEIHVTKIK